MPTAMAVLVGLSSVDPNKYLGWDGRNGCSGCELDVDSIQGILQPLGYEITVLKTAEATRRRVMKALRESAALDEGDIFVFYYSGHGGQQPDQTGRGKDELDGQDETLLLHDGELRDDSLNDVWIKLKPGVRAVMLSDSCNSGSNYRGMGVNVATPTPIRPIDPAASDEMRAQMIHMGGCRDGRTSDGYPTGGLFTLSLAKAWRGGQFKGSYRSLYKDISKSVTAEQPGQEPAYNEYGEVSPSFRQQRPFTI